MKSLSAIVCIYLATYFISSDALECYSCVFFDGFPRSDSSCQNNPDSSLLKTCIGAGDTIPLCEKGTGTLEGKPAVLRRCGTGDSQADGMCKHHSFLEIGDKSTHDAYVCACAGDKCNGASNLQFTNFSFFAFAVHVLYKLVLY